MLLPLIASVLIVFGSPYVGQIRGALQTSFPDSYRGIVGAGVGVAGVVAIASAIAGLRRRRDTLTGASDAGWKAAARYAPIVVAVAVAAVYEWTVSTGNPDVDLVEAFHFVEYGVVAYLFYRVWRSRPDVSGLVFSACAGLAVGIADESVQWFVPGRVGELHDVGLNAVAIGCGLLVGVPIHPPSSVALPRDRRSRLALGAAIGGLLIACAGFVDRVHLGYEIADSEGRVFRSQFDTGALVAASVDRVSRWKTSPPPLRGFTREDHYLSEGQWHVQRRNLDVTASDWWSAWNENAILERFYGPVLDRGARWSDEQAMEIARRAHGAPHDPYVSDAAPYPIFRVRRSTFWMVTVVFVTAIVWVVCGRGAPELARV